MSRIIAGAAGGTPADVRPREPDPAHHGPRQGGAVLPAGRLQRHCRRPGAGPLRGLRLAGGGERQPRRRTPWTWSNSMPRPAPSASGTRTWSTPWRPARWCPCTAPRWNRSWTGPPRPRAGTWCSWTRPTRWTKPALAAVLAKLVPHLGEGAVVVVERSSRTPEPAWPEGLERFAEKKYGETRLWFAEPGVEP